MENDSIVKCAINTEWLSDNGATIKKISYKFGTLRLIRNEMKEMFVEMSSDKTVPIKLRLKSISVHKKFMMEGKASIKFIDEKCTLFLSNAPPGTLIIFLRTLMVKLTGDNSDETKEQIKKNIRAHMLSGKPSTFEDVSPITNVELNRARSLHLSKASTTTPSPPQSKKRKLREADDGSVQRPAPKKLYTPSPLSIEPEEKLNQEQTDILQACISGKNVFFTGSAGTGKSFLLRKIISILPPDGTVATASTGVAACLIGGVTLHSFAGIGAGEAVLQRCYEMASRPVTGQTWRKCKRLIIDEISMVDGKYFEKIEAVAREIRRNDKPFGGIQLILCGDFLQLPPVIKNSFDSNSAQADKRFCFQTPSWEQCIQASYELQVVHRQKDSEFVKILNHIRIGHVTDEITERLLETGKQIIEKNGILATQLCSHTNDANSINESKLENLKTESKTFNAQDSDASMQKLLDMQVPAPGKLILKIGAQVMLLKNINISDGLVNGARGVVVKYNKEGLPIIKFKNNKEYEAKHEKWMIKTPTGNIVSRKQIPLRLAWAFSIHKSQGLTLDCVEMSLSKVFEAGQAYVALSRAMSLDSLRVLDFDARQVWANPVVLQFYKKFRRDVQNISYIPLGEKNKKATRKPGVSKTFMNKPLVSIS